MTDTKQKPSTINQLKRRIKELEARNEELRASVGYEELKGWRPNERLETQYGWVYTWLYPLQSYLSNASPINPERVMSIVTAILAQMSINGKYGIKIPLEPVEYDSANYFEKQRKYIQRNYDPCVICGENRITHECHIIPRSDGGPDHRDNFFTLCPLHHHLFDNSRLNQDEWKILSELINTKMESAVIYFKQVREPMQQNYWQGKETLPLHLIKK
jgi:hypothetical protein